jgi:hypothetical protein
MTKSPLDHVQRPELPWRTPEQAMTECGLPANSYPTITRSELAKRWKDFGQQRTAMTVCMTCFDTAKRWRTWQQDPLDGIQRALRQEPSPYRFGVAAGGFRTGDEQPVPSSKSPLRAELRALAILAERHSDEFHALVRGLMTVGDLAKKRREKRAEKA